MPDVTATEAISKAVVREAMPATPVLGSRDAVAAEMIRKTDEGNWREGLQFGSETTVGRDQVFGRVDQIGTERDASGKRIRSAGSPEEQRHQQATKAAELALKFEEKGYDGLTTAEKRSTRDALKNIVLQSPNLAREFNALNPAKQQEFLERLLNDSAYTVKVKEALREIVDAPPMDDSVLEKQDTLSQRTIEQAVRQSELADVQRRLDATEARLRAFDITTTPPGTQAQEIERIRANMSTLQVEAATFQQEMGNHTYRIQQLEQERGASLTRGWTGRPTTDIDNAIMIARGELQTSTTNFNNRAAEINKLPQLEQEQARLEEQRLNLAREKAEKEIAKGQADNAFTRAQRELQDALDIRKRQEEALVQSLDGVFSNAAKSLLDSQIEAYGQNFEEALKKVNKEEMDVDEKAVIDNLPQRWIKVIPKRRFGGRTEPRRVMDEAKVNNEFGVLMSRGKEAYIRDVLSGIENPATPGINYTPDQITALFAREGFLDKVSPVVLSQLIARKAVIGGIETSDVYTITQSKWGKEVISLAVNANDSFKSQVEALLGKGAVDQPDFMEKLSREAGNHPKLLAVLAAALAGLGGATVGVGFLGTAAAGAVASAGVMGGSSYAKGNRMFG